LARKLAIVAIVVFDFNGPDSAQLVQAVAVVSLVAQLQHQPYDDDASLGHDPQAQAGVTCVARVKGSITANRLETASLFVVTLTFYLASFLYNVRL
jgi:hypothetical protein